jgi:hypothetical protein
VLFLGISDWKRYFHTATQSLKPGGVIEHQDLDWKFYSVGSSEVLSDNWPWWHEVVKAVEESGPIHNLRLRCCTTSAGEWDGDLVPSEA